MKKPYSVFIGVILSILLWSEIGFPLGEVTKPQLEKRLQTIYPVIQAGDYSTFSAAVAAAITQNKILEVAQQINITVDTDLSALPGLRLIGIGSFNISVGKILTLPVNFNASICRIFLGSGTAIFSAGSIDFVRPEWWYSGAGSWHTAINNAITSFGVYPGTIQLTNRTYTITANVNLNNRVVLQGMGTGLEDHTDTDNFGTCILKDGDFTGITLSSASSGIRNILVKGKAGNGGDGIWINGNSCFLERVDVENMGNNGIVIGDAAAGSGNANSWRLTDVLTRGNTNHGILIDDLTPNANAGVAIGVKSTSNGGDGVNINNASTNNFYGIRTDSNTGYGVRVKASARNNSFWTPYAEMNTAGEFIFEVTSANNLLFGTQNFTGVDNGSNVIILSGGGSSQSLMLTLRNLLVGGTTARYSTALNRSIGVEGTTPGTFIYETDAAADAKLWAWRASAGVLSLKALNDAASASEDVMNVTRTGNTVDYVNFPNGKVTFTDGIGVGNSAAGDVTGTAKSKKLQIFNASGVSLGYIQIYDGP